MADIASPIVISAPVGSVINMADYISQLFSGASYAGYYFYDGSIDESQFGYWGSARINSRFAYNGTAEPVDTAFYVPAAQLNNLQLVVGNEIEPSIYCYAAFGPGYGSYMKISIVPTLYNDPTPNAITGDDVVAAARTYLQLYQGSASPNGCHSIASDYAAAAGAPLPAMSGSLTPSQNLDGGLWSAIFKGDVTPDPNWQNRLQPGDIVRFDYADPSKSQHTFTVMSVANGKVDTIDNWNAALGEHQTDFSQLANASTVTIYRITDQYYHLSGTVNDDLLIGSVKNDAIDGGAGNDTIYGGVGNDILNGQAGNDILRGGEGGDVINGGDGIDTLFGNQGGDRFVFDQAILASNTGVNSDLIQDFNRGNAGVYSAAEGDTMDLSALLSWGVHAGQTADHLVRVVEDQSGAFADVQMDSDGLNGGVHWTTIAHVAGTHQSETFRFLLDAGVSASTGVQGDYGLTGDFDGDGKADILWRNDSGTLAQWQMNAAQVMAGPQLGSVPDNSWHVVGVADFNGDGKSDLLWRNDSGALAEWMMNGSQIVSGPGIASSPDKSWNVAGTADFDGDGKADILWRNDSGGLALWTMNGAQVLSGPNIGSSPDPSWHIVGVDDFGGDGKADILWRNDNGTLAEWSMNGSQILAGPAIGSVPDLSWHVVATGDLKGDVKADILWRNDSGTLAEWQMNNGQILAGPQIASTPDLSWHVIGTGDFNGDHKTDILWRNDSGTLAEWTMDGAQVLAGPQIGSIPDATWKTVAHHYDFV